MTGVKLFLLFQCIYSDLHLLILLFNNGTNLGVSSTLNFAKLFDHKIWELKRCSFIFEDSKFCLPRIYILFLIVICLAKKQLWNNGWTFPIYLGFFYILNYFFLLGTVKNKYAEFRTADCSICRSEFTPWKYYSTLASLLPKKKASYFTLTFSYCAFEIRSHIYKKYMGVMAYPGHNFSLRCKWVSHEHFHFRKQIQKILSMFSFQNAVGVKKKIKLLL